MRFAAVKRGETRLRRGALTMSALCRLVLQLRTYRCIAADDATGQEETHALQHDRKQKDRLAAVSPKLARPTSSPGFARAIKRPA